MDKKNAKKNPAVSFITSEFVILSLLARFSQHSERFCIYMQATDAVSLSERVVLMGRFTLHSK